jgi:hypothetical protein
MTVHIDLSNYLTMAALALSLWVNVRTWFNKRYNRSRRQDVAYQFVVDMAENHLPHVYECLRLLGIKLGVELGEIPPIRFVNFEEQDVKTTSASK